MQPIQLDDFLRFSYLSALQYAPDGRYAAFVRTTCDDAPAYHSEIWLLDAETGAVRPLTATGKERSFCWDGSGHLLFAAQRTDADSQGDKQPSTTFYRLPIDGGEARRAFSVPLAQASAQKAARGYLLRATVQPQADPLYENGPQADVQVLSELPFWVNGRGFASGRRSTLYHYLPETDGMTVLSPAHGQVAASALSDDGTQAAYAVAVYDSVHPQRHEIRLVDLHTHVERVLLPGGAYNVSAIAFWGDALAVSMSSESNYGTSENDSLYRLPLAGGAPALVAAPDTDIGGNVGSDCRYGGGSTFACEGGLLHLTLGIDDSAYLYTLAPDGTLTRQSDGNGSVDCFATHGGRTLFVGMRDGGLQALYQLENGEVTRLTDFNGDILQKRAVATPQPLSFVNGDNIRIDGWALTPPDFDASRQYPAILHVHGGPKAVFGAVFHHEMQFWAARGFVVLYCNPRGSGGRGNEFADLRGRYGTIDYDDLMAFLDRALDAYPAIDRARVCVAGGSYGGFMVNWMIGHTDRFIAAASQRSIANWTSKCLTTDIGYYHNLSQIAGDPWSTPALFWEKSPLRYAPQVQTPTLFIHSDEDYRCWMSEGLQMFTALKMHGVPTRLCLFHGENHELSRAGKPANRIRRLAEIYNWFAGYCGLDPIATAPEAGA